MVVLLVWKSQAVVHGKTGRTLAVETLLQLRKIVQGLHTHRGRMMPQPLPPPSKKVQRSIEAAAERMDMRAQHIREYFAAATEAAIQLEKDLSWVDSDDQQSLGFFEARIFFKGDKLIDAVERNGFKVEGQSGFYHGTFERPRKEESQ